MRDDRSGLAPGFVLMARQRVETMTVPARPLRAPAQMRAGLAGFGAVAVGDASQPLAGGETSLAAALA